MTPGKPILDTSPKIGSPFVPRASSDISAELSQAQQVLSNTQKNIKAGIGLQIAAAEQTQTAIGQANIDYINGALGQASQVYSYVRNLLAQHVATGIGGALDTWEKLSALINPTPIQTAAESPTPAVTTTPSTGTPSTVPLSPATQCNPDTPPPNDQTQWSEFVLQSLFNYRLDDALNSAMFTPADGSPPVSAATLTGQHFQPFNCAPPYFYSWVPTPASVAMLPLDSPVNSVLFGTVADLYLNNSAQGCVQPLPEWFDYLALQTNPSQTFNWTMLDPVQVQSASSGAYGGPDIVKWWTTHCCPCPPAVPPAGMGPPVTVPPVEGGCAGNWWIVAWPSDCNQGVTLRIENGQPPGLYYLAMGPFCDANLAGIAFATFWWGSVNGLLADMSFGFQPDAYGAVQLQIDNWIAGIGPPPSDPSFVQVNPFPMGNGSPPFDTCTCPSYPWTFINTNNAGVVTQGTYTLDCVAPPPGPPGPPLPPLPPGPPLPPLPPGPPIPGCPPPTVCPPSPPAVGAPGSCQPVPICLPVGSGPGGIPGGLLGPPCPPPVINVLPCGAPGSSGSDQATATADTELEWLVSDDSDGPMGTLEKFVGADFTTLASAATREDVYDFWFQAMEW